MIKNLIIIWLLSQTLIYAQERRLDSVIKELNVQFTTNELKSIEKGLEYLKEADVLLNEAKNKYSELDTLEKQEALSKRYLRYFKMLVDASDNYRKGNMEIYSVFKEKCDQFWIQNRKVNHFATGVEKGRFYEKEAKTNLAVAAQRRQQGTFSERFEYALWKIKEAYELEELAVRDQGRALQVYTDYPVEYFYGWEDEVTVAEILEMYKNPAVKEPPDDIFATVDPEVEVDSVVFKEIIFKVQIAAHTVPLTQEYLRTIYKGDNKIDMIYEDGWYKYSIGRYKEFAEANQVLEGCNVRRAFIAAYEEGKKITIKEALEKIDLKRNYDQ